MQSLPIIWLWNSRLESCRQHHSHPPSCCQQQTAYPSLSCHLLALRQKLVKLWYSVWAAHCSDWYLGCATLLLLLSAFLHCSPTHQSSVFSLLLPKSLSHVTLLFPQAVLPKDTASCLESTYTGPKLASFRQGCKPTACLPNSIFVSSPTAHDRDCTPVVVMRLPESQTHLRHHSGGDKCEKQNQWNGNFCCFLASETRVDLQRNRHDKTLQYTGHKFTWSMRCMCCLIIQTEAD